MDADADARLRALGLDGRRLAAIAKDVSRYHAERVPYCSEQTRQALASFLTEVAVREVMRFDPTRSKGGYSPASYLWDVLNRRCVDFYRRKSEGFGDRRAGNDNRLVLQGDPLANLEGGVVDADPFEADDSRSAAEEFADAHDLSPASTFAAVEIASRVADGCGISLAAREAGVSTTKAKRLLEQLGDELVELGVVA